MQILFQSSEDALEEGCNAAPSQFFVSIRAELIETDEDDQVEVVGRATACVYRHQCAAESEVGLFDVSDSIDSDTQSAWWAVMDPDTEEPREGLTESPLLDVLYIKTMQILPSHRGRRLGQLLLLRVMQRFGSGCALVVIEPAAMTIESGSDDEWNSRMEWPKFGPQAAGLRKLRKHWRALGFKPVPGSMQRYFFLDLGGALLPNDWIDLVADDPVRRGR